jgi:hypothetical protein
MRMERDLKLIKLLMKFFRSKREQLKRGFMLLSFL